MIISIVSVKNEIRKILVLGHRGCAGLEPENTILSFKKAIDIGVDLIEFDVRMTKDRKLVVIHDLTVDRTTNGKGFVKDLTFNEIKKLDAGKGEKIPSLEEALDFLKDKKPKIVIEIKEVEAIEDALKIVKKMKIEEKVMIVSFYPEALKKVKEIDSKIETGFLFKIEPRNWLKIAKEIKADYIGAHFSLIDENFVKICHKNNFKINAWTVNEDKDIERMIKLRVDIISSDYPNKVLDTLFGKSFYTSKVGIF